MAEPDRSRNLTSSLLGSSLQNGRYRLDRLLGEGGQGAVFLGSDLTLRRPVAIKALPSDGRGHSTAVDRFKREALRAAQLQHPNIVQVYDYGYEDRLRLYYIVSEYVPGSDLKTLLRARGKPFALEQVLRWAQQVASALDLAHSRDIIHRDIKPGNILIDSALDDRAVLCDFGLARMMTDEDLSVTSVSGGRPGTVAYMSPEQCLGRALDRTVDVYALAWVVYELLAGRHAFVGPHDTSETVRYKQVHEPPPAPHAFGPHITKAVGKVLIKALAKDPRRRYQTASEFVEALKRANSHSVPMPPFVLPSLAGVVVLGGLIWGGTRLPWHEMSEKLFQRSAAVSEHQTATPSRRATATASGLAQQAPTPTAPTPTDSPTPAQPVAIIRTPESVATITATPDQQTAVAPAPSSTQTPVPSDVPVSPTAASTLTPTASPTIAASQTPALSPTTRVPTTRNTTIRVVGLTGDELSCCTIVVCTGPREQPSVLSRHVLGDLNPEDARIELTVPTAAWFKLDGSSDGKCPWGTKTMDPVKTDYIEITGREISLLFGKIDGGGGKGTGEIDITPF